MKEHPIHVALEQIDDRASSHFRETLRTQLVADLVAPSAIHQGQEPIMTTNNEHAPATTRGRRALLGVAAAALLAAGVTAVAINRNNADSNSVSASDPTASSDVPSSQAITVIGDALVQVNPTDPIDPAIGQPAPLISGFDFQGNPLAVDPTADGPYMIVFLAHWCPHCNAEVPRLLDWKASGSAPAELNVIAVSTAAASSAPNFPPSDWFADKEWSWPVLVDESQGEGNAGKAATAFGATGWPFIVIIGADGLVKARIVGEVEVPDLQVIVDAALAG